MSEQKNNLNTLFERLREIDIFDKNFSEMYQNTYQDFFRYDKALVSEKPRSCDLGRDKITERSGRISTDYKGAHFEMFFKEGQNQDKLVVGFDVARRVGAGSFDGQPYFPRWSWYTFIDGHFLCIEDPMYYDFPDLEVGWFYGTKEKDYAVITSEIIKKAAGELNLQNEDIILYSSSAGGATAIRTSAYLQGCKVAVINPRLEFFRKHHYLENFTQTTKIDLTSQDKFYRNNLIYLMQKNIDTNFFMIFNAESRHDIDDELTYLIDSWPVNVKPGLGLTRFDNVTIWIYDGPGKKPHNVQDDYRLYSCIRYLLNVIKDEDFVEKYQNIVMYINDWWRFQSTAKYEISQLKSENELLKEQQDKIYKNKLKNISNDQTQFNENITARIDIINNANNISNYNDLEWITISDPTARVQAPRWFTNNGQGYVIQSMNGNINFSVKCYGDGKLEIYLRGIYKKDNNGNVVRLWIDYTSFSINNEIIFNNKKSIWHNKPYKYSCNVNDGDIIICSVTWEEHID